MIAFIGLGNNGEKYSNTKHNAGFWVVDEFVKKLHLSFVPGNGEYVYAQHKRWQAIVVKPTTGMNRSGNAIKEVITKWDINLKDLYVVLDDVDLPLGSMRVRPKGGDGCHRGLENIIYQLQSEKFPRVRLGIGTDTNMRPAEEYVLKPFHIKDEIKIDMMINNGASALENILVHGISHTMNNFNSNYKE